MISIYCHLLSDFAQSHVIENLETLLNLFVNSMILKDALKDFERIIEYDTFTPYKFVSKKIRIRCQSFTNI